MEADSEARVLQTISDEPYNAETPLSALLDEITEADLVYVRNHFEVPAIDENDWSLAVDGEVQQARSFSLSEIKALPTRTLAMTLECAGNGRKSMLPLPAGTRWGYGAVSLVEFTGTPVSGLLEEVGIQGEAAEAVFHGADRGKVAPGRSEPYARSLPLELARHPDTLLAWEMNSEPLAPSHGFPLRLVVPGWYGMASVKWLRKIELSSDEFKGFFQDEHYIYTEEDGTPEGEPVRLIRVRSLILSAKDQKDGEITLEGIAWSGSGSIARVEIGQDGGSVWHEAELESASSVYGVQRWRCSISAPIKDGLIVSSRAADSSGNIQPTTDRWNRLGYGNNGLHSVWIE